MGLKNISNNNSRLERIIGFAGSLFENKYVNMERLLYVVAGLVTISSSKPWDTHIDIFIRGGRLIMPVRWGLTFLGIFFVFFGLLHKFPKKYHEEGLICPKCLTPYGLGRAPKSGKCKNCDVELEPIDGFYDRHPELRDKKDEVPEDLMDDLK
ncbi:hypothetical protein [Maridesulfovibrio sp.]|uniref:hypothetical protein n=1 Tax=Maridesulfovibrio sp. TaxID=2795000 RepID=UPI002A18C1D2|nr:hypothetical protein [Maridesulfovibrio sp.]